jgi:hypothetical protein
MADSTVTEKSDSNAVAERMRTSFRAIRAPVRIILR